ncbi:MAG: hypothetical protein IT514_12780, partial [Burkholderiales bacterium]|nr:hypothetical protein [Burkholderiales bacterium]
MRERRLLFCTLRDTELAIRSGRHSPRQRGHELLHLALALIESKKDMPTPKIVVPEPISLRNHPDFSEKWLEDQIVENPSLLKLGEVEVRGRQRIQPRAGRLDLLLEDVESRKRYEVELQLGKTDESHVIRTIEYWDIERKRYPQYEHCAVVVAEDITSRFLNVLGLFNGIIPLIAIQLQAVRVGDGVALIFTQVLDELELGLEEP